MCEMKCDAYAESFSNLATYVREIAMWKEDTYAAFLYFCCALPKRGLTSLRHFHFTELHAHKVVQ